MTDSVPALEAHAITRTFGGLVALDSVDLRLNAHEILGLVGPNGSGKTTLLHIMSGYIPATSGEVRLQGTMVEGWPPERLARHGMSRTFQQASIFPECTPLESVLTGMYLRTRKRVLRRRATTYIDRATRRTRAMDLIDRVGLAAKYDIPARELGIGEQKHLGIAVSLAREPSVLLLDEPAAGMGEAEVGQLKTLIEDIRRAGVTLLVVEHNMDFIMTMCDRVIVLAAGAKLADGRPSEVGRDPAVIAAYLGKRALKHVTRD